MKFSSNERALLRRYLIWCYKTTKEDLDRIERYYTQIQVDYFVTEQLKKPKLLKQGGEEYLKRIKDFEQYIQTKKNNVDQKKYKNVNRQILNVDYLYLKNRFACLEKAIVKFLGKKVLGEIAALYEAEMTNRILEAREHT